MNELIRFNYMHRDSGNWKKFGRKLFSNPDHLTIQEIEQKIRKSLIDQEYFYPDNAELRNSNFIGTWMIIRGTNLNQLKYLTIPIIPTRDWYQSATLYCS